MAKVKLVSKNDEDTRRPLVNNEPSMTKQEFKDEVNVNSIMRKYFATGALPNINESRAFFGDVSGVGDYRESLELVRNANESFMNLPSKIRNRFDNDPGKLLDFLDTPSNKKEAEELGIIPSSAKPPFETQPQKKNEAKDKKINDGNKT